MNYPLFNVHRTLDIQLMVYPLLRIRWHKRLFFSVCVTLLKIKIAKIAMQKVFLSSNEKNLVSYTHNWSQIELRDCKYVAGLGLDLPPQREAFRHSILLYKTKIFISCRVGRL